MKKVLFTLTLALLSLAGFSQFGASIGLNYSTFKGGQEKDRGFKPGFIGGIYDRIYLSKTFSIEPALRYESKGGLINYDVPTKEQFRLNIGYVTLPILLNLHLSKTFAISGGYYAAYGVFNNIGKWNYDNTVTAFPSDKFHRLDHGYVAGISADLSGLIVSADASLGNRLVGHDGEAFGRGDVTPDYNHVYKNFAANISVRYPFRIRSRN